MDTEKFHITILKTELSKRMKANPRYSLRAFAQSLSIDPGTFSKILNGSKRVTPELSKKILLKIDLSPKQRKTFLDSMALSYEEQNVKRLRPEIKKILKSSKRTEVLRDLTPDIFAIISDWYHYALLQLMEIQNFQNDHAWIAKELGVTKFEVKMAVERLVRLGIIEETDGKLNRTSESLTSGDTAITTAAHRNRIKQITDKSIYSLENDSINVRNHTTMTMSINPELIPIAKDMIQDFMTSLSGTLETNKKQVYELQINLFPLQRNS